MNKQFLNAGEIFEVLIDIMGRDNGGPFKFTEEQKQRAIPPIEKLQEAGYFADNPQELDDSFWQCVAGEVSEAENFFCRASEAYDALSVVLEEVFHGG